MELSKEAKRAIALIQDEYGDEVLKELNLINKNEEKINTHVLTNYHLLLLRRAYFISNNGCEFGAMEMDGKRPYGNEEVWEDIRDITGITSKTIGLQLHYGLHAVVKCIVSNPTKTPEELIGTDLTQYELVDYHNKAYFK